MASVNISTGAQSLTSSSVSGGALSVQTNTSNALFVDANGNVGIGTGVPLAKLDFQRGSIVNLGDTIKTSYIDRGFTAASFQGGYNTASLTGPVSGVYTFTIGNADTNAGLTVSNFASTILPGSTYEIALTASSLDSGVTYRIECPSFNIVYTSPVLTTTMTTYTANIRLSSTDFTFRILGGSGKSIRWNAFYIKRLDSLLTGGVGIGTTNPQTALHVNGGLLSSFVGSTIKFVTSFINAGGNSTTIGNPGNSPAPAVTIQYIGTNRGFQLITIKGNSSGQFYWFGAAYLWNPVYQKVFTFVSNGISVSISGGNLFLVNDSGVGDSFSGQITLINDF